MPRPSYSDKQKAAALEMYEEKGPSAVERELKIPKSTVRSWAKAAGVRTVRQEKTHAATEAATADRTLKREQLKAKLLDRILDLVDRMSEPAEDFVGKDGDRVRYERAPAKDCQHLGITTGILIEKLELLEGRATGRQDVRNVDQIDREIERLTEQAAKEKLGQT